MASDRTHWPSRLLHYVDEWSGLAWVALALSVATLAVICVALAADAGTAFLTGFAAVVQAVTLAMVFVVQHTQDHNQNVTQRKLDELLRAVARADNTLIHLETAADDTIEDLGEAHERLGRLARKSS